MHEAFGVKGKIFKRDVYLLRKRNKQMAEKISQLKSDCNSFGLNFVAGFFDAEGPVYLSSKSKIPVIDITQCERGLKFLETAKSILEKEGIVCNLNGPYIHKHAKLPQYHLRIYGIKNCKLFLGKVPIFYREKFEKTSLF